MKYDVVVIGAGASGMMAAIQAVQAASSGMADVLTQAETNKMVNFLLQVIKQDFGSSQNLVFA